MKPIKFPEAYVIFAENQPEYQPLPSWQKPNDPQGETIFCWKLTWWERIKLLFTGKIWHRVYTFNKPLQPQWLQVEYPFLKQSTGGRVKPSNIEPPPPRKASSPFKKAG